MAGHGPSDGAARAEIEADRGKSPEEEKPGAHELGGPFDPVPS